LHNSYNLKKNFKLIGSAHNLTEIRIKEKQNVSSIFISSIFKNNKYNKFLGIYRFLNLIKLTKKNIVSLGGINKNNIKKIKLLKINNIASISMFQNLLKKHEI
jgi:thiamine-phosphate pyrophosphorylase